MAIDYYRGETGHDQLSILAVERAVASSFDACEKYACDHEGNLPTVKFEIEATFEELLEYFKRFSLVLRLGFNVDQIEIKGTKDLRSET